MLDKHRLIHIAKFVVPALVVLLVLSQLSGESRRTQYSEVFRQFRDEKNVFVDDFLTHEIDGTFEGKSLTKFCGNKTWTEGLMLSCDGVAGGLGDTKNGILTCIRIAVEMGAEVVLPTIVRRSTIDLSDVIPGDLGPRRGEPLSYFFDHDHLIGSLNKFCPQLKVHDSLDSFYDNPNVLTPAPLDVYKLNKISWDESISKKNEKAHVLANPSELVPKITAQINKKSPPRERKYPFRVALRPTPTYLFPDNYKHDKDGNIVSIHETVSGSLAHDFGRLLRVRNDLRRLAASMLFNLHKTFNLDIDPRRGIQADRFAAVELRTNEDVRGNGAFPSYAFQASDVFNMLVGSNVSLVFLADGASPDNVTSFNDRARDFNINVVGKSDLVEGNDLYLLNTLTYDQRGLVDYEVMVRSGLFAGGTAASSNAWNVALRRAHAFAEAPSGVIMANRPSNRSDVRWVDEYSTIFGKDDSGIELEATIWP